ncbi:MAG: hypothetical protein J6Z49_03025 [Kiritimatiellae bacterium]|nr:hypothetical protein [Kiritimatiellia bacterium]
MKTIKTFRHLFNPQTWVKIENRARKEGKTPEAVACFILSNRVGLIPAATK